MEQKDKSAVSFVDFCGAVVEYSNDGVLYTDSDGNRIWNQAFEMSSPQVVTCESFMTIYDRGGTDLYIMDKNGVKKRNRNIVAYYKSLHSKPGHSGSPCQ